MAKVVLEPSKPRPYVTYAIIVLNALIYLITSHDSMFMVTSGYWVSMGGFAPILLTVDITSLYRVFTSMFMHADFLHIFFNMYFLYIFGRGVEAALGPWRYLALYLGSGIAADVFHTAFSYLLGGEQALMVPAIGASGAISGVLGAYLVLYPGTKLTACTWFILPMCFTVYSAYFLLIWFAFQVLYGFTSVGAGIAFMAHAGGFVAGIALLGLLASRERIRALRSLSSGGILFGFIRYMLGEEYYPKPRLASDVKAAIAILVLILAAGSLTAYNTSSTSTLSLDVSRVVVSTIAGSSEGYIFYDWSTGRPLLVGLRLVSDEVRVLLNRLYASGLLYDPQRAGSSIVIRDRMIIGSMLICDRIVHVRVFVDDFRGKYDSRGLLVEASGRIASPIITVFDRRPIICYYKISQALYTFSFSLKTYTNVDPTYMIAMFSLVSLLLSLLSLYTLLWRDKELVITPMGAESEAAGGIIPF